MSNLKGHSAENIETNDAEGKTGCTEGLDLASYWNSRSRLSFRIRGTTGVLPGVFSRQCRREQSSILELTLISYVEKEFKIPCSEHER